MAKKFIDNSIMLINKNNNKMIKKLLCFVFAFILSINCMAAVVNENDGTAFTTKAEFEALKKKFCKSD